jgi:hypothetical protein
MEELLVLFAVEIVVLIAETVVRQLLRSRFPVGAA